MPLASVFDPATHLAWGDMLSDGNRPLSDIRKCSNTTCITKFMWTPWVTTCTWSQQSRVYVVARGDRPGLFFHFGNGTPLTKA